MRKGLQVPQVLLVREVTAENEGCGVTEDCVVMAGVDFLGLLGQRARRAQSVCLGCQAEAARVFAGLSGNAP